MGVSKEPKKKKKKKNVHITGLPDGRPRRLQAGRDGGRQCRHKKGSSNGRRGKGVKFGVDCDNRRITGEGQNKKHVMVQHTKHRICIERLRARGKTQRAYTI